MQSYMGITGSTYNLAGQLGGGGEGTVFAIQGSNDKVAKLYKPEKIYDKSLRDEKERKLKAMLRMKISPVVDGVLRLAWPLDILYSQGQLVGFVMPKITNMLKIFDIQRCWRAEPTNLSTIEVLRVYPNYTWKYSVQFAYNLAWVVKYVHSFGIVIGDLNQNNIYADTDTGAVVLIDCDSFDVTDKQTGERFPCEVGFSELLAPELQSGGQLKGRHTKDTDNFSLAIHIFRLLMRNANPFGGVPSAGSSSSSITRGDINIIQGNCPFVRKCGVTIQPMMPDLSILPLDVQNLFRKTFDYTEITAKIKSTKRATASEWCNVLAPLAAAEPNHNLKKCTNTNNTYYKYHVYPIHNATCPWCKCEGYIPPKLQYVQNNQQAQNLNQKNKVSVVQKPINVSGSISTSKASVSSKNKKIVRRKPYLFYIVLIVFGIASGFIFENIGSEMASEAIGSYINPTTCAIILAIMGAVGGGLLAHHFEDSYIYADNAIPWLFLGGVVIFIPPVVSIVVGIVVYIVILIIGIILSILAVVLGVACLFACLSGS